MIQILNGGTNGVYIGRGSFFGNPYKLGEHGDRERVIELYREDVLPTLVQSVPFKQLVERHERGEDLAFRCFCAPLHCHGDVIAEVIREMTDTKIMRLIIAGSQHFTDYERLVNEMNGFKPDEIISGRAKGADSLGERYAKEYGITCRHFPADWKRHENRAGMIRNRAMADFASKERGYLLAFWNGSKEHSGTWNMIQTAERYDLESRIVKIQHQLQGELF